MISAFALMASSFNLFNAPKPSAGDVDDYGHSLVSMWNDYYAAQKADRPKKMTEILSQIKTEAVKRSLAWDFYDAGRKYVESSGLRNWKQKDSLFGNFGKEIAKFDNPLVTFVWKRFDKSENPDTLLTFVKTHKTALSNGCDKPFFALGSIGSQMGSKLKDYYANDYEFALWELLSAQPSRKIEKGETASLLKSLVSGQYPNAAYLDYYITSNADLSDKQRKAAMTELAKRYSGNAVGVYPAGDLLSMKFDSLSKAKTSSSGYQEFDSECKAFEKFRDSFRGSESEIAAGCTTVYNIVNTLNVKDLNVFVLKDTVKVVLKNIKRASLSLVLDGQKKPLLETAIVDERNSFYVNDTVRYVLPKLNDGRYYVNVKSGACNGFDVYEQYTISLAKREELGKKTVYVADYNTGKPIRKASLTLTKNGKTVAEAENFAFDGFTPLPASFSDLITKDNSGYQIYCSCPGSDGLMRKSRTIYLSSFGYVSEEHLAKSDHYCEILTDRGAYRPGDTVSYKAILYYGDKSKSIKVFGAGSKVTVTLCNAENKVLETSKLTTNEFGSVAGEFVLPKDQKNGTFFIETSFTGGQESHPITVDEFVLPTFDVDFFPSDTLWLPGDAVVVKGSVTSYSGHSLAGTKLNYIVRSFNEEISSGAITPASDGSFHIGFKSSAENSYKNYLIVVTLTDGTGETHSYSTSVVVSKSLTVEAELKNHAQGSAELSVKRSNRSYVDCSAEIVDGDSLVYEFKTLNYDNETVGIPVRYEFTGETGDKILSGETEPGGDKKFDISSWKSGQYTLTAIASFKGGAGMEVSDTIVQRLLVVRNTDKALDAPVKNLFKVLTPEASHGKEIKVMMGSADGPVWAVVGIFGKQGKLLLADKVHLEGKRGEDGSLVTLSYPFKDSYPNLLSFQIFYFKDSSYKSFSHSFECESPELSLPLSFTSFTDKAVPSSECSISLKTLPGVECLAAVFDKSTETIRGNVWDKVSLWSFGSTEVSIDASPGTKGRNEETISFRGRLYGDRPRMAMMNAVVLEDDAMMEKADSAPEGIAGSESSSPVPVRENFSNSLTFQPFLHSDSDGNINLSFKTSDKLSTYIVSLFAHDKAMKNAVLRKEMMVTIPVKVSVTEPGYLYAGDKYSLAAMLSNNSSSSVSGKLTLCVYDTKDYKNSSPVSSQSLEVSVPALGTSSASFEVPVPSTFDGSVTDLGFKVLFEAHADGLSFSDGIFVSVPLLPAGQTLSEAHSAVLLHGMDRDSLIATLREAFVNVTGSDAILKETSVIDMVRAAIPSKVEPEGKDVLSLSEAYYIRKVASALGAPAAAAHISDEKLWESIIACKNVDGGYGWFEGMNSSPVITSVLLERFAKMKAAGLVALDDVASSVRYLDNSKFSGNGMPYWCGSISDEQYIYVRSMFPEVPMRITSPANSKQSEKEWAEFKKFAKSYLVPGEERGLNGYVLAKARRTLSLSRLAGSSEGVELAKAWGVRLLTANRLFKSLESDVKSLMEYAVEHKNGGCYYPNAVMPFRGLLESEAYAHSLICDLMSSYASSFGRASYSGSSSSSGSSPSSVSASEALKIADGIRLWLMLQKETQRWDTEPAFVDAINSILAGSSELLDTKVIALSKTFTAPVVDIKPSGNGFTIKRNFYREVTDPVTKKISRAPLKEGAPLNVGDKICAEYKIHNDENRSFVKLTAPREAAFRPADQLSGHYGWWLSPLRINGFYTFSPQGYRNMKTSATEYYFDSYPEETTSVTEEFFATQKGIFIAPVVTIESLYAPHYRANGPFAGHVDVVK